MNSAKGNLKNQYVILQTLFAHAKVWVDSNILSMVKNLINTQSKTVPIIESTNIR